MDSKVRDHVIRIFDYQQKQIQQLRQRLYLSKRDNRHNRDKLRNQLMDYQSKSEYEAGYIDGYNSCHKAIKQKLRTKKLHRR